MLKLYTKVTLNISLMYFKPLILIFYGILCSKKNGTWLTFETATLHLQNLLCASSCAFLAESETENQNVCNFNQLGSKQTTS